MQANEFLFLTGYRATGKSTVGKLLASSFSVRWMDTDAWIEHQTQSSIAELFEQHGESHFRDWETRCLRELRDEKDEDARGDRPRGVISLGGGAILRRENRQMIRESGRCVWLTASSQTLADRLAKDSRTALNRPSLTGKPPTEEIDQVLTARLPFYREVCDFEVSTEQSNAEQLATSIRHWWSQPRTESR
ncbi:MAG: shikimate kinase [Planctomycetota bacterium]